MSLQQGQVSTTASGWSRDPSPLAFYLPLASCICATWIAGVHHQTWVHDDVSCQLLKSLWLHSFSLGKATWSFFMKDLTANGFWVSSFHLSTDMQTDIISYMYHMGYHLSELSQHRTMRILTVIESGKKTIIHFIMSILMYSGYSGLHYHFVLWNVNCVFAWRHCYQMANWQFCHLVMGNYQAGSLGSLGVWLGVMCYCITENCNVITVR